MGISTIWEKMILNGTAVQLKERVGHVGTPEGTWAWGARESHMLYGVG